MYIFNKPLKFLITMFMAFLLTIVSVSPTFFTLNFGSLSLAQSSGKVSRNYDSLYTSSVIMLRNAKYGHILNIAEGPIGSNVVWSPATAVQNNDNTIVVVKKEGVNIVQLFNRATRKVLGVNKSGGLESKLEVQNVVGKFNQYQSFYVDYLPNGNIYFSSVAFPNLVINLPWGGSNKDNKYQLYDKVNIGDVLDSQFTVDLQGDGANVSFWDGSEVVADKVITEPKPTQQVPQPIVTKPIEVNTPKVDNQYAKLKSGAVVVLRNVVKNNSLRILNTNNGTPIYSAPNGNPNDDSILVAVNKPNTNIYQFFNRKNGKVLSVTTKGQVGDWLEVWDRVPNFNPYQSFYIDVLPNGNIVLCPVAFPDKVINLPEGGKSNTYQHFTLWNKDNLVNDGNRQFRVDLLGDGADVSLIEKTNKVVSSKVNDLLKNQNSSNSSVFNGKGPSFDYTPDPNKSRDGLKYVGTIEGNSSGYPSNLLLAGTQLCERYVNSIQWKYKNLYTDKNGKKRFGWSLNIVPSKCSVEKGRQPTPDESWNEVVKKAPLCTEYITGQGCKIFWDQKYGSEISQSMYKQYVCHTDFATITSKKEFNLEPDRLNTGLLITKY